MPIEKSNTHKKSLLDRKKRKQNIRTTTIYQTLNHAVREMKSSKVPSNFPLLLFLQGRKERRNNNPQPYNHNNSSNTLKHSTLLVQEHTLALFACRDDSLLLPLLLLLADLNELTGTSQPNSRGTLLPPQPPEPQRGHTQSEIH